MTKQTITSRTALGTAIAAVVAASIAAAAPAPAFAQPTRGEGVRPANDVTLSVGTGRMVRLDGTMSDLFVANDKIADVQVHSSN
ncbi:MAG: secretion system protein, partial [Alphaproteobacteria bacterium]